MNTLVQRPAARRGFTLVEVMISVALVLVVVLGVNQVFALTSQAVGSGQALGTITRDARVAQSTFHHDLSSAEIDRAPFFIINSESLAAFRNIGDQLGDKDYDVTASSDVVNTDKHVRTIDRNENGIESDDLPTARCYMTSRTHRADQLIFFTRNTGRRQTGNSGNYTSNLSSSEQYVSYGHLRQPGKDMALTAAMYLPGVMPTTGANCETPTTNPNNFYATQWVLGRSAVLLREPSGGTIKETGTSTSLAYIGNGGGVTLAPLAQGSQSTTGGKLLQQSVFDLAGTSISGYRDSVVAGGMATGWTNDVVFRFAGFPTPPTPLASDGAARTVPCFVAHCTQFAVEYAGDFLDQDVNPTSATYGKVNGHADNSGNGTDGQIDFIVQSYTLNGATRTTRRTRWYGFPRDTSGAANATISGESAAQREARVQNADKGDGYVYAEDDVVPLRDVAGFQFPFERVVPAVPSTQSGAGIPRPASPDYSVVTAAAESLPNGSSYRCAWGPDTTGYPRPKMLRITMAIDDPSGRVGNEQYFEYIVELQ